MFKWIRSKMGVKLLLAFSIVLILSMLSLAYIATQLVVEFGGFAASANEQNIRDHAKIFLARITHEQAMRYESVFNTLGMSSALIAKEAAFFLEHIDRYGSSLLKKTERLSICPKNGIFSNDASETTMMLFWGAPSLSPKISDQINALSHLDPLLQTIKEQNPQSVACYAVTESGIANYYPNNHGVEELPQTTEFDIRNANWYDISRPKNNLEEKTVWSNIYLDSVGQGLLTTASTPIYSKSGQFLGAAGVDITLDTIVKDILGDIPSHHQMADMFSFLVDNQGRIIAFPEEKLSAFGVRIDQDDLLDASVVLKQNLLAVSNEEIKKAGERMLQEKYQVLQLSLRGKPYVLSSHFMPSTGWRLGTVVPEATLLASVKETREALNETIRSMVYEFAIVTALFLLVSIAIMSILATKTFIRPLRKLSKVASHVKEGDLTSHSDIRRNDEIGLFSRVFDNMVDALYQAREREKEYSQKLEEEVIESTKEIRLKNEKLRQTHERLELAMDAAEHGFWDWNLDTDDIYFSPRYYTMLGYEPGDLPMKLETWIDLMHPDDRGIIVPKVRKHVKNAQPYEVEFRLKTKDGTWKWISGRGKSYEKDQKGTPHRAVGVHVDISYRKEAEEERAILENQLRQAQKMEAIGTLSGGIAHDFNNILSVILGNTELAMGDIPEWNPARNNLREVRNACDRAKEVIQQILGFSRKSESEMRPVTIAPIIKETLKLLRASIPSSIEIRQRISAEMKTIQGDPTQVHQVLLNLCTNAAHAMEDKGGILDIELDDCVLDEKEASRYADVGPGRYVKLSVRDNGQGMDPDVVDRIFDPYFTTKGVGKGTGMGLALVHGIVKSHGGAISVTSTPGEGTTFEILFPIVDELMKIKSPHLNESLPHGHEKILFVDDEAALVRLNEQRLTHLGYQVETQTDPLEALERFRSQPDHFDLVITDTTMPHMTGDRLAREIMRIRPDIPVLLCTGYSDRVDKERARDMGIAGFAMKPIDMGELARTVRELLDNQAK